MTIDLLCSFLQWCTLAEESSWWFIIVKFVQAHVSLTLGIAVVSGFYVFVYGSRRIIGEMMRVRQTQRRRESSRRIQAEKRTYALFKTDLPDKHFRTKEQLAVKHRTNQMKPNTTVDQTESVQPRQRVNKRKRFEQWQSTPRSKKRRRRRHRTAIESILK